MLLIYFLKICLEKTKLCEAFDMWLCAARGFHMPRLRQKLLHFNRMLFHTSPSHCTPLPLCSRRPFADPYKRLQDQGCPNHSSDSLLSNDTSPHLPSKGKKSARHTYSQQSAHPVVYSMALSHPSPLPNLALLLSAKL